MNNKQNQFQQTLTESDSELSADGKPQGDLERFAIIQSNPFFAEAMENLASCFQDAFTYEICCVCLYIFI